MRCLSPRTVGWDSTGKSLCWSKKTFNKELATFQLPCGKCIECRLEYARTWAIRSIHEAQMHPQNSFITLTYSDAHLKSPRLQYSDFQLFAKRLRSNIFNAFLKGYGEANWSLLDHKQKKEIYEPHKIGIFVTGEYGDRTKRPHWHAIIFNWWPPDATYHRSTDLSHNVYKSALLDRLWGLNDPTTRPSEVGTVTFESAGYVARYAAKKLEHGNDQEHEFHPISKKSSHQAIGKKFLEKYYKEIFNNGYVTIPNGTHLPIPRYYEKWFKENHPDEWLCYLAKKLEQSKNASIKAEKEKHRLNELNEKRLQQGKTTFQTTKDAARTILAERRLKRLNKHMKGNI